MFESVDPDLEACTAEDAGGGGGRGLSRRRKGREVSGCYACVTEWDDERMKG